MTHQLTPSEAAQIDDLLRRRANDIAHYHTEHRDKLPAPVEYALTREIDRLRRLAECVKNTQPKTDTFEDE